MKFSRLAALVVFIFPINYCLLALNIDSLVVEAERIEDKQDAFLIYRNIALKLIERNGDSALLFANKAAVKAKASGRPKAKYYADKLFGKVYREQGEKDVALEYFFTAIDSAKSDSNYKAVSYIYSDIAELHRRTGAYHKAIETWNLATQYSQSVGKEDLIAKDFNNIGLLLYYLMEADPKNGDLAIDYLKKSVKIKLKYNEGMASSYHNLSMIYNDLDQLDSSYKYVRLAINENKQTKNYKWLFLNYLELIDYYIEKNEPNEIKPYLDSAKALLIEKNLYYYEADYLQSEASYFNQINKPLMAIKSAKKSLEIATKNEDKELEQLNFFQLHVAFLKLNQLDSSNHYFKKYDRLKSQQIANISSAEAKESLNDLDLLFKQQQIDLLDEKNRFNELKAKSAQRINLLLASALLLVIFIVSILFNFIQQKRKLNQKLNDEALVRLKQEAELKQLNAVLKAQEEEKNKISSELHDHIGGSLAALKMRIDRIDNNQEWQNDTIELVDQIAKGVRNISHLLSANKILKIGLKRALVHLASHFESGKTQIKTFIEDLEDEISDEMKINIFRIIQELFTNVQKHANASTVFLQIVKDQNFINISVEDNGVGFDSSKKSLGIGLDNINDRVKTLKGEIEIDSKLGKGTSVTMQIPLVTEKV